MEGVPEMADDGGVEVIVTLEVGVMGYGSAKFSGVTYNAAFVRAWRSFQSARDCTFKEFMKIASRHRVPNPRGVGDRIQVLGRDAWLIKPDDHSPLFTYVGETRVLTAHHSDVVYGL